MTPQWNARAHRRLWAGLCQPGTPGGLWNFLRVAWGWRQLWRETGDTDPWLTTAVHRPMVDWLDRHICEWLAERARGEGRQRHVMLLVPRGMGKTSILSAAMAYIALADANASEYICSAVQEEADKILLAIRSVWAGESPHAYFTGLYGTWYDPERMWRQNRVVHAARTATTLREPSLLAYSVEKGVTGHHQLVNWGDDRVSYENLTDTAMQAAITSFDSTSYALRKDSLILESGTRYHEDDPLWTMLTREGVASWSGMECPYDIDTDGGEWHVYFLQGEDAEGKPVCPQVWPAERIAREKKKRPDYYASQIQNMPMAAGSQPLTRHYCETLYVAQEAVPWNEIAYATVHLDTAFAVSRAKRGDKNVVVTALHSGTHPGRVYYWACRTDAELQAVRWNDQEFLQEVIAALREMKARHIWVKAITDEKDMGGKDGLWKGIVESAIKEARPSLDLPEFVTIVRQTGPKGQGRGDGKPTRLLQTATYWLEGHVRLVKHQPGMISLMRQMTEIRLTRHDDVADAASDAFHPYVWTAPSGDAQGSTEWGPLQPWDQELKGTRDTLWAEEHTDVFPVLPREPI